MKPGGWVIFVCWCLCSLQAAWKNRPKLLPTSPELGSAEIGGVPLALLFTGVESQICTQRRMLHGSSWILAFLFKNKFKNSVVFISVFFLVEISYHMIGRYEI